MSTHEDEGVYRSPSRRAQRWKKAAVGVAGLAVIGSGAYFATDMYYANRALNIAEPPPPSPHVAGSSARPTAVAPVSPSPFLVQASKSGVRRQAAPSPTPSPSLAPDDQLAANQVNRLLQAPEPSGMALADSPVTVARSVAADGSQVRVVSARRDLTQAQYGLLLAADPGEEVGDAHCTQNFRSNPSQPAQLRPTMLLCWRASAAKSVVTIAVAPKGKQPLTAASVALLDIEWSSLG